MQLPMPCTERSPNPYELVVNLGDGLVAAKACAFARVHSSWLSHDFCVRTTPEANAATLLGQFICQRVIVEGRADWALPPLSDAEAAERCTCLGVHSAHGFLDEGQTCVERAARAVEDLIVAMAHYLAHQLLALQKRGQRQCA
mmetsp:Transcript_91496/g.284661  ORF Transcript_91496/g.284661 Transcript_91496/m.284661 type:complete len:143 (+) Transcript_91496:283-711(+)